MSERMQWTLPAEQKVDGLFSEVESATGYIRSIPDTKRRIEAINAMRAELDSLEDVAIAELVEQEPYINDSPFIESK